jgi:hypothetical protein
LRWIGIGLKLGLESRLRAGARAGGGAVSRHVGMQLNILRNIPVLEWKSIYSTRIESRNAGRINSNRFIVEKNLRKISGK